MTHQVIRRTLHLIPLMAVFSAVATHCQAGQQVQKPASGPSTKRAAKPVKPAAAFAAGTAKTAIVMYQCPDCLEKFTAAQAKKSEMKCSCCQTKLVLVKPAATKKG